VLNVSIKPIMLSIVMLNVVMPSVIMLNVVAPSQPHGFQRQKYFSFPTGKKCFVFFTTLKLFGAEMRVAEKRQA
jgi:hypothetical protein